MEIFYTEGMKKIIYLFLFLAAAAGGYFCLRYLGAGRPVEYSHSPASAAESGGPSESEPPKIFTVSFSSVPAGASYKIAFSDGTEKTGKFPFVGQAPWGVIKVSAESPGYAVLSETIEVFGDLEKKLYFNLPGQLVKKYLEFGPVASPKGAVFTSDGREIWTTALMNKKYGVAVFDADSGKRIADINLGGAGGVEVIFGKDGKYAYVSQMETALVYEISRETKKITRTFNTKSAWTKVLALSPDGKTLYAANWSGNDVSVFDLETGALVKNIKTVKTPRGLFPTKDGKTLFVAGFDSGEIQKINLLTGEKKVIYKTGGAMRHIAADEDNGIFFISDMGANAVFRVDMETGGVTKFADTEKNPNTIALSPDKKILFVSCRGENYSATNYYIPGPEWGSVLIFDTASGKMLDAIVGGNQPTALDVSLDGRFMVFSNFLDGNLEVFSIPAYNELANGGGGRSAIYKSDLPKKK